MPGTFPILSATSDKDEGYPPSQIKTPRRIKYPPLGSDFGDKIKSPRSIEGRKGGKKSISIIKYPPGLCNFFPLERNKVPEETHYLGGGNLRVRVRQGLQLAAVIMLRCGVRSERNSLSKPSLQRKQHPVLGTLSILTHTMATAARFQK